MKIMIVDDDSSSRIKLKVALEKVGHEVVEYSTGVELMSKIFRHELAPIIFLDWMMPGMSGIELCQLIRKQITDQFVYVILLTSKTETQDVLVGLRAGADDYLMKPLELEELYQRLEVGCKQVQTHELIQQQKTKLLANSKMILLGNMSSGIAYEMSNPLTIVSGKVSVLSSKLENFSEKDKDFFSKNLNDISSATQRMTDIVQSLKTLSSDEMRQSFETVLLKEVLDSSLSFFKAKFMSHGIKLKVASYDESLRLECQRGNLIYALMNIFQNSFQALESHPQKEVNVEVMAESDQIHISIQDSGVGIAPEIREMIYYPFFTTKPTEESVGLGLTISKGIIEKHNGNIKLDTQSPFTRFIISIPKERRTETTV